MSEVQNTNTQGGALTVRQQIEQLPAFMQTGGDTGMEALSGFIRPERIKFIQKMTKPPLSDLFEFGDAVLVPSGELLAPVARNGAGKPDHAQGGLPFHIIPLFCYPEWCLWNPHAMQGSLPVIRERSLDKNSEIARRAKNPKLSTLPCPENPKELMKFSEHLNFVVRIVGDNPMAQSPLGELCGLTFRSGSYKYGTALLSLMRTRRDVRTGAMAKIYGCVFEIAGKFQPSAKGDYYAPVPSNPSEESGMPPYVNSKEVYEACEAKHLELKQAHADNMLIFDHDDEGGGDESVPNPGSSKHEF